MQIKETIEAVLQPEAFKQVAFSHPPPNLFFSGFLP
jgi:hypothetical protein